MMNFRPKIRRAWTKLKELGEKNPRTVKVGAVLAVLFAIYVGSKSVETVTKVVHISREGEFKPARIFGGSESAVYEAKERNLSKIAAELLSGQKKIAEDVQKVTTRVDAIEAISKSDQATTEQPVGSSTQTSEGSTPVGAVPSPVASMTDSPPPSASSSFTSEIVRGYGSSPQYGGSRSAGGAFGFAPGAQRIPARGPDVISFPVANEPAQEELGVVLPVGSYVKAKVIAGTDATTGDADPVLLQLDFSHVLPNQRKIDLSGCFMTAKAKADLSTERVKMQTHKISCVSKLGMVFERDVNGYVADDTDNRAAVTGPLRSRQDRVAAMAFLASVVEGVGKAVQQAQTTQQTTPLGGDQSVMTGDQKKYLAGGAAANAGSMVAQWYLKQAESLLPSITVGSGRDVWVILLNNVNLPKDHFMKGQDDARYAYVTRILD